MSIKITLPYLYSPSIEMHPEAVYNGNSRAIGDAPKRIFCLHDVSPDNRRYRKILNISFNEDLKYGVKMKMANSMESTSYYVNKHILLDGSYKVIAIVDRGVFYYKSGNYVNEGIGNLFNKAFATFDSCIPLSEEALQRKLFLQLPEIKFKSVKEMNAVFSSIGADFINENPTLFNKIAQNV